VTKLWGFRGTRFRHYDQWMDRRENDIFPDTKNFPSLARSARFSDLRNPPASSSSSFAFVCCLLLLLDRLHHPPLSFRPTEPSGYPRLELFGPLSFRAVKIFYSIATLVKS
jgi:hypothetical protein